MKRAVNTLWIILVMAMVMLAAACQRIEDKPDDKRVGLIETVYDSTSLGVRAFETMSYGFCLNNIEINNPYDSSEITVDALIDGPDGQYVVPAFWFQDYERSLWHGREKLTPKGKPCWMVRFTPKTSGEYSVEIRVTHGGKTKTEKNAYTASVAPGNKDAFLRVADDKAHLEFSNGGAFTGIGHNLCGWEWAGADNQGGTYDYDKWFNELKSSGANMVQFDLCEGDNIEWTSSYGELPYDSEYGGVGVYNQMTAWKMDYKVDACDSLGLYYRLSLYHWEDFDNETKLFPDWGWSRNPYNAANGGPCKNVSEFFESEEAKRFTKDYLRYAVARWGYSTNMIQWELWNEADSPDVVYDRGDNFFTEFPNILSWHDEMAKYIKSIDVNKHLVTTSFAYSGYADEIWRLDSIDVTTFHRYSMYNSEQEGLYNGIAALNGIITERLQKYQKPVIPGEFALSPGGDIQRENDREGIGFHNQIWSSLFAGAFGTAMHWTWGSYIDEYDLYHIYTPLYNLLGHEDLRNVTYTNNISSAGDAHLYMAMTKSDRAFIWVKDRNYDYYPVVNKGYQPVKMSDIRVPLDGLENGTYEVIFYDTWSGNAVSRSRLQVDGGKAEISVPEFYKDIAVKVVKKENAYTLLLLDKDSSVNASGTMKYWSDAVDLRASGLNIGGISDQGGYAYISCTGDIDMIARVAQCTYIGTESKAGIMLRDSTASVAPMVFVGLNSVGNAVMVARGMTAMSAFAIGTAPADIGDFVKLEKRGSVITGYVSADGVNWTKIASYTLGALGEKFLLGVATSSNNNLGYNDARFERIDIQSK